MDYTKKCWYCGKQTMESKGSYYQCTECGATWNEQPALGPYQGIATERGAPGSGTKGAPKMDQAARLGESLCWSLS